MATVIGEIITTPFHSHNMIANPPLQQHHHHHHPHHHDASSYRSNSRPRTSTSSPVTKRQRSDSATEADASNDVGVDEPEKSDKRKSPRRRDTSSCVTKSPARIPSPPASSSPHAVPDSATADDVNTASMESSVANASQALAPAEPSSVSNAQQPSPVSDGVSSAPLPAAEVTTPAPAPVQTTVQVRDLAHIAMLARTEMLSEAATANETALQTKYDISGMPVGDVIEMVAALLTKITSTNDLQYNAMQRNVAHQQQANQSSDSSGHSHISPMSHSVLAFHGKNVPAITIHSYLARIHKYCPTTFEVFLSLLVYFDRMTERVDDLVTQSEEARRRAASHSQPTSSNLTPIPTPALVPSADVAMRDSDSESYETDSDLADDDDDDDVNEDDETPANGKVITVPEEAPAVNGPSTYFVVDSFNIHRLIIAGVTCSSKFFSDVFYTNSRYAKVGGLPLAELNHLELQFLVLNAFRLSIPVEDLEAYATMLVEFYAREVVSRQPLE